MASVADVVGAIQQLNAYADEMQGMLHAVLQKAEEAQNLALGTFQSSNNEATQQIQGTLNAVGEDIEILQKKFETIKELGNSYISAL